ncbi:surface antigen, partial [Plasmodium falciparum UGT5.1]
VNTHKKKSITPRHIQTTRLLCECELYMSNYDNDPEIKRVMQQFHDCTTQRFQEYDERLQEKRQIYKDKCDKEIQKIILKDKIEKELAEKFSSLHTDIQSDGIPTCICEKSLADKVEKGCLRCGSILGAAMPEVGSIGGGLLYALNAWKPVAIEAAEKAALSQATDAATQAGVDAVVSKLKELLITWSDALDLSPIVTSSNYKCGLALVERAKELFGKACKVPGTQSDSSFCNTVINYPGSSNIEHFAQTGAEVYTTTFASKSVEFKAANMATVDATYGACQNAITASVITIVVIILIMVIIYLILRYRRKKKMKKKLQYIKLLEE